MSNYLITLKPVDKFFFGQESKYRRKVGKSKFEADYFQRSAMFPQQTTILGMLRYYLLLINNELPITKNNKEKADIFIGSNSFQANSDNTFGKIKSISPVFITDPKKNIFLPNPKNVFSDENNNLAELEINGEINTDKGKIPFFENYDAKEGLSDFLLGSNAKYYKKYNDIFIEDERIGITKSKREEAFYKQIVYKIKADYSFAFYAEIDIDDIQDGFVPVGAEKSVFKISFEKINENRDFKNLLINQLDEWKKYLKTYKDYKTLVLLSDAYLPEMPECLFAISETIPFRFLITKTDMKNEDYYANPLNNNGGIERSERFNLIKRGSVFFFENENQLNKFTYKLDGQANFKKIGYNYYLTINKD